MTDKDIVICGHGSGNPSLKNLNTYATSRYNQKAPNGKRKGIVCVRRLKKMTDEKRKEYKAKYKTILGRNIYSNDLREYVYHAYRNGKFYSDCSSSQMATFEELGIWKGSWLLNTEYIYRSDDFEDVPVKIKDGHITNPEVLKVGDMVLFAGSDPGRPLQIGHVEGVYEMPDVNPDPDKKTVRIAKPTLRKGNKNTEVKYLQKNLNRLGIKDDAGKKLEVDGDFGPKTDQAVRRFQKVYKLEIDGIYGQKSYAAMKEALA